MPLILSEIQNEPLFGKAILQKGDCPETIQMILDQMEDNFAMVVSIIGYRNARYVNAMLVDEVNKFVHLKGKIRKQHEGR